MNPASRWWMDSTCLSLPWRTPYASTMSPRKYSMLSNRQASCIMNSVNFSCYLFPIGFPISECHPLVLVWPNWKSWNISSTFSHSCASLQIPRTALQISPLPSPVFWISRNGRVAAKWILSFRFWSPWSLPVNGGPSPAWLAWTYSVFLVSLVNLAKLSKSLKKENIKQNSLSF